MTFLERKAGEIATAQDDFARGKMNGIRKQSHHGKHRHTFAGTGLPDQPEYLMRIDVERCAIDQTDHALGRRHLDNEIPSGQKRLFSGYESVPGAVRN